MAIKLGAENKRNVYIAGGLFCVLAYLVVTQFTGPSTPTPVVAPTRPVVTRQATTTEHTTASNRSAIPSGLANGAAGPQARKVADAGLDPALHLEKLALSESIEYAGSGRNIFSADSAPIQIETALESARAVPTVPTGPAPYVAPQAPPIDLKFFGYSASEDGKREAFLLRGDDIFEAAAGEIVSNRYKVVAVDARSIQVTDLSYNNTQTLPLMAN